MTTVQASIIEWFKTCKPEPKEIDVVVQIGVHFEEVTEMLSALLTVDSLTPATIEQLRVTNEAMLQLANHFKNSATEISLKGMDIDTQELLLDTVRDQAVTGMGICTFLNPDYNGALIGVSKSNHNQYDSQTPIQTYHKDVINTVYETEL